jgi:hypothetical protein
VEAERKEIKPLPPPNSDFYQLKDILSADELALVKKVRFTGEFESQVSVSPFRQREAKWLCLVGNAVSR